jgi:hypothetical protein
MMETVLHIGCTVFLVELGEPSSRCRPWLSCSPQASNRHASFLKCGKAQELVCRCQRDKTLVSGRNVPPSLQHWLAEAPGGRLPVLSRRIWGCSAYETEAKAGAGRGVIEIVRPGTGVTQPRVKSASWWPPPEPRTTVDRFGTGDLSMLPGHCRQGAPAARIKETDGPGGPDREFAACLYALARSLQFMTLLQKSPRRLVVTGEMANDSMTFLVRTVAAPSHSDGL